MFWELAISGFGSILYAGDVSDMATSAHDKLWVR
jgi:hypothetical protein